MGDRRCVSSSDDRPVPSIHAPVFFTNTALTRARSAGKTLASNHGLNFSQQLLRGLGCGMGSAAGQCLRQPATTLVTDPVASGNWYA